MRVKSLKISAYGASQALFLLGVFLKQFYLFSSGGFQLGDFCFMGSFAILLVFVLRGKIPLEGNDQLFLGFVGFVALINFIYFCIYGNNYPGDARFQKSIIYYVYSFFIIVTFRQLSKDKDFLLRLRRVFQAAILMQLFVLFAGLGRYGSMRYMGTFNDPNQCGFYILSSYLAIFIITQITKKGHLLVWFAAAFYLIMRTVSTGMLLGMAVLLGIYVFIRISEVNLRSAITFAVVVIGAFLVLALLSAGIIRVPDSIARTTMYQRAAYKTRRFGLGANAVSSGGLYNLFVDRCWDRLIYYPTKILYGAGEAYYSRFPSARYSFHEIHSSIFGPLFYYGIVPCSLWFAWTAKQLKGIKRELWPAYLALIIESFTLVNNRQPFFWMIFVLAGSSLAKKTDMRAASSNGDEGLAGGETVEAEYS